MATEFAKTTLGFIAHTAAHGVSQGILSMMQGGNFFTGAASGMLGHLGAEAWGATMRGAGLDKFAQSTGGMVAFGAISGGVGAELSGGNFWQGAVTGGIVAGLNSAMHKIGGPGDPPTKRQKLKKSIDVTDKVLKSTEAISALDKYIADATKSQPNKILGKSGRIAGNLANVTSVAVSGLEYYNGDISGLELTFDLGAQATSIWISSEVGASLGGPYGFAAGAAVGSVSEFVVKPLYKNAVRPYLIVPAQKSYNRSWTNFYNNVIFNISRYK